MNYLRLSLLGPLVVVFANVGESLHVATAEEADSVFGHWRFEPSRLEGNKLKSLAGPDGTPEGLGRSVRFIGAPGPSHAEFLGA